MSSMTRQERRERAAARRKELDELFLTAFYEGYGCKEDADGQPIALKDRLNNGINSLDAKVNGLINEKRQEKSMIIECARFVAESIAITLKKLSEELSKKGEGENEST